MDLLERRALLKTSDNPNKAIDYLITLDATAPDERVRICIRYIPDKIILQSDCLKDYVKAIFSSDSALEDIATKLVDDFNNELVARWVQVNAFKDKGNESQHSVVIEDRQPQWENPHLMARIASI